MWGFSWGGFSLGDRASPQGGALGDTVLIHESSGSQQFALGTSSVSLIWKLKKQVLVLIPRSTESETLGGGPQKSVA